MNYPHPPYGQQQPQQYSQGYQQPYGQPGYGQPGYGPFGGVEQQSAANEGAERLAFLRKVYGLFAASIVLSGIGAMIALYAGQPVMYGDVPVPPLVSMVIGSPIIAFVATLGLVFGVSAVRRVRGVNVVALFGMAFLLGIVFAPSLFIAQLMASTGETISAAPIRDAFILASLMFGGLTGYVVVSKRDFSFLGSALTMGLFVVLGAAILNLFFQSNVLGLAIASVGVILFGGYVLFDTWRILRSQDRDAVGGALTLYLDFLNLFIFLLRILGSRR